MYMSSSTPAQKARGRKEGHTEDVNNRKISGIAFEARAHSKAVQSG